MKGFYSAFWSESLKARKAKMLWGTLTAFTFIGLMMGLLVYVLKHPEISGRSATISAKAAMIGKAEWPIFFNLLVQVSLALGPLGYGVVTSWIFGREYSDRCIKDLLALPVSRSAIALAKFFVVILWSVWLSLTLFTAALLTGLAVGITRWSGELALHWFLIYMGSSLLTIALCSPVALIACFSRGYLPPIGFAILTLILTNLVGMGMPQFAPYFPWAVPAVFSGTAGPALPAPGVLSFALFLLVCFLGLAGTLAWWKYADQM
jgi:ABC-2 type transport system permease protein